MEQYPCSSYEFPCCLNIVLGLLITFRVLTYLHDVTCGYVSALFFPVLASEALSKDVKIHTIDDFFQTFLPSFSLEPYSEMQELQSYMLISSH